MDKEKIIGPLRIFIWSENHSFNPRLDPRRIDFWKYYCPHGWSGVGFLIHLRKLRGIGITWYGWHNDQCNEFPIKDIKGKMR